MLSNEKDCGDDFDRSAAGTLCRRRRFAETVEDGLSRVAALYDIATMDVAQTTDNYMVPMNVFDRLFESEVQDDGSTAIVPSLCEGYTVSEDGLTYTFTLREGVVFSTAAR